MPQLTAAVRGRSRCCPAHPDQSPPWRTHHFRLPLPRLPPRHLPPLHHHLFFRQRQPTQSLPLSPRRLSVPLPRMRAPCLWRRRRYGAPRRAAGGPRYQPGSGAAGSMPTLWQSTTTRVNRWLASSSVSIRTTTDSLPAWHMPMGPPTSEGTSRTSMELRESPLLRLAARLGRVADVSAPSRQTSRRFSLPPWHPTRRPIGPNNDSTRSSWIWSSPRCPPRASLTTRRTCL